MSLFRLDSPKHDFFFIVWQKYFSILSSHQEMKAIFLILFIFFLYEELQLPKEVEVFIGI